MQTVSNVDWVIADASHASQFKRGWMLHYHVKKLRNPSWTWRPFQWDQIIQHPLYATVAAEDPAGRLEGLLALQQANGALKVAFVATAPWNSDPGKLRKGVGPALLLVAIDVSSHMGFDGALVLSSTPESESFYAGNFFVDTKKVDHEGLKIFDLSAANAAAFVAKHQAFMTAAPSSPSARPSAPAQSAAPPAPPAQPAGSKPTPIHTGGPGTATFIPAPADPASQSVLLPGEPSSPANDDEQGSALPEPPTGSS